MLTTLDQAPIGIPLHLVEISSQDLKPRLARLGLYKGSTIRRLNKMATIRPIKVVSSKGEEVTLSGWLAGHIVIHLNDGRRLPILECAAGDSGHVEGLTGHSALEKSLAFLGITENSSITFLRHVPPMTYKALVNDETYVQFHEGLASKLLGHNGSSSDLVQFGSIGVGEQFTVEHILSGESSIKMFTSMGIKVGDHLKLVSVSAGQIMNLCKNAPIVCVTQDDLRLYIKEKDAQGIWVEDKS